MSESWQKTACILCSQHCGVEVVVDGRRLSRLRGDGEHPISRGYTCEKALRLDDYQNGNDRLTAPLRRRPDGTFEAVDWATAVAEVAALLGRVRGTHGGETILHYAGGGQGNHLGGAYSRATRAALRSVYAASALAHAGAGVDEQLYGRARCHASGDFEHAEVAVFVGTDPWQSHGFPRARVTLEAIAADPARALVVIDPRRSETAERADFHLQIRPGTDVFCLLALLGVLIEEDLVDHAFLERRTSGFAELREALAAVSVAAHSARAGVPEALVREVARRIARAAGVSVLADFGPDQGGHAALGSYLAKLVFLLTGNFGRRGAMNVHTRIGGLVADGAREPKTSPVGGHPISAGLIPCDVIPDEILGDHPRRFRAMLVESESPERSLGGESRMREALGALEALVVIDVAMTETARLAHYVLPASSHYEKWEASFFNVGLPENAFQLRAPVLDPLPGTLAEPEIHRRLVRALGALRDEDLAEIKAVTRFMRIEGREPFADAFFQAMAARPHLVPLAPIVLYETLGPSLPDKSAAGAVLWGLCHLTAGAYPDSLRRAGFTGDTRDLAEQLFDAMLMRRSGVVFSVDRYEETWRRVETPDRRVCLSVPELLAELARLPGADSGPRGSSPALRGNST